MLGVLLIIQAFNYMDGLALGLVLQNIKVDLGLTDTQLGLLTGIAFALFYSVMGIPIARWADRGNRVLIISITTALWSVAVALCGVASNFIQLLVIRAGVAVGEAGCIPPAHSLIADYFTRAERPRAVGLYMLGAPLASLVGYLVAGWLNQIYGWRGLFVLLGLPGLVLSALAWFTLKEPRLERPASHGGATLAGTYKSETMSATAQPRVKEVIVTLWTNATFRHLLLSFSIVYFFGYGIVQWQPAFFIRSYGMETGPLGTLFALIFGLGGIFGTYMGGVLASRYAAYNEGLQLKVMAIANVAYGILLALIYLSSNRHVAFALLIVATIGGAATNGPLFATIQTLIPQRMRAISIAVIYLFANLIGMGLGPLAAGALSDALRPLFGEESLRYALLVLCPGYLWGGWHLWCGSKTVARDFEVTHAESQIIARARIIETEGTSTTA